MRKIKANASQWLLEILAATALLASIILTLTPMVDAQTTTCSTTCNNGSVRECQAGPGDSCVALDGRGCYTTSSGYCVPNPCPDYDASLCSGGGSQ